MSLRATPRPPSRSSSLRSVTSVKSLRRSASSPTAPQPPPTAPARVPAGAAFASGSRSAFGLFSIWISTPYRNPQLDALANWAPPYSLSSTPSTPPSAPNSSPRGETWTMSLHPSQEISLEPTEGYDARKFSDDDTWSMGGQESNESSLLEEPSCDLTLNGLKSGGDPEHQRGPTPRKSIVAVTRRISLSSTPRRPSHVSSAAQAALVTSMVLESGLGADADRGNSDAGTVAASAAASEATAASTEPAGSILAAPLASLLRTAESSPAALRRVLEDLHAVISDADARGRWRSALTGLRRSMALLRASAMRGDDGSIDGLAVVMAKAAALLTRWGWAYTGAGSYSAAYAALRIAQDLTAPSGSMISVIAVEDSDLIDPISLDGTPGTRRVPKSPKVAPETVDEEVRQRLPARAALRSAVAITLAAYFRRRGKLHAAAQVASRVVGKTGSAFPARVDRATALAAAGAAHLALGDSASAVSLSQSAWIAATAELQDNFRALGGTGTGPWSRIPSGFGKTPKPPVLAMAQSTRLDIAKGPDPIKKRISRRTSRVPSLDDRRRSSAAEAAGYMKAATAVDGVLVASATTNAIVAATTAHNTAVALTAQNKTKAAALWHARAVRLSDSTLGPSHPLSKLLSDIARVHTAAPSPGELPELPPLPWGPKESPLAPTMETNWYDAVSGAHRLNRPVAPPPPTKADLERLVPSRMASSVIVALTAAPEDTPRLSKVIGGVRDHVLATAAATLLQRAIRRWLRRKRLLEVLSASAATKSVARAAAAAAVEMVNLKKKRNLSATRIQAWWRAQMLRGKLGMYTQSAIKIQSLWRGGVARMNLEEADVAAGMIQACWLYTFEQRTKHYAASTIQALVRGVQARATFRRKWLAATTIQSHWRSYVVRVVLYKRLAHVHGPASIIQASWRGHVARKEYKRTREAATLIAAWVKGAKVRAEIRAQHEAATTVQAHIRGWSTREWNKARRHVVRRLVDDIMDHVVRWEAHRRALQVQAIVSISTGNSVGAWCAMADSFKDACESVAASSVDNALFDAMDSVLARSAVADALVEDIASQVVDSTLVEGGLAEVLTEDLLEEALSETAAQVAVEDVVAAHEVSEQLVNSLSADAVDGVLEVTQDVNASFVDELVSEWMDGAVVNTSLDITMDEGVLISEAAQTAVDAALASAMKTVEDGEQDRIVAGDMATELVTQVAEAAVSNIMSSAGVSSVASEVLSEALDGAVRSVVSNVMTQELLSTAMASALGGDKPEVAQVVVGEDLGIQEDDAGPELLDDVSDIEVDGGDASDGDRGRNGELHDEPDDKAQVTSRPRSAWAFRSTRVTRKPLSPTGGSSGVLFGVSEASRDDRHSDVVSGRKRALSAPLTRKPSAEPSAVESVSARPVKRDPSRFKSAGRARSASHPVQGPRRRGLELGSGRPGPGAVIWSVNLLAEDREAPVVTQSALWHGVYNKPRRSSSASSFGRGVLRRKSSSLRMLPMKEKDENDDPGLEEVVE